MRPRKSPAVKTAAITHPGMSGKNNEDRFRLQRLRAHQRQEAILAIVADGIGGHRAGEIAAELVCEQITRSLAAQEIKQPLLALRQAIQEANQAVVAGGASNPQWKGMGSTCACALVVGKRLYTATAGDSRIYLLRGKQIFQLNRDHTWIQEAIELGTLPPATAHLHPNAHVIRRYLGSPHGIQADTRLYLHGNESDEQAEANQGLPLQAGDRLVICSDGLTDLVAAHEILDITRKRPLEQALERLVQLANQRGGHDNITIVALQVGKTSSRLVQWLVASTLLALVALALVSSLLLFDFFGGEALLGQILPRRTASSTPVMQLEKTLASPLYPPTELPLVPDVRATLPLTPSSTPLPSLQPTATFTPWPTNTPEP